jgi:Ca-activated chloride channel family protein
LRHIINIALLLFCPLLALCQFYIKGQVTDEGGSPLQNVSIILQSTNYRYYTGAEGAFGIISNKVPDTLFFTYDGFESRKLAADASKNYVIKLKRLPLTQFAHSNKLASLTTDLRRETQQQWFLGDETYASLIENQFIEADHFPSTGLTLNVDRASYSNIRRFLNMKAIVPPDAVRIEEMVNYFNLRYQEPPAKKTFSIRSVLTTCPWNDQHQLLMAQINSRKLDLDSLPATHLVFLIDVSGSMNMPNRLPLLKSGFKALVNNLRAKDSVSIVVYGGTVGVVLNTTGGAEKEKIFGVIDSLQPGGSTPGESGVKLAYSVARNHFIKGGNNRVILATDGDFNVGLRTENDLNELIEKQRSTGIYLTCLGVGMGNYKDSKIQTLAQRGNGNFAYLDSYAEAEKVLLKEFTQTLYTVADDARLYVTFDPKYVKEYRLVGFDNKVGAIKDTLAAIEGGEIGSAYSSLVAFELIPAPAGELMEDSLMQAQPVLFNLKYMRPGTKRTESLQERPVLTFTPFDSLDSSYRFASSVIMFGSMLKRSKFAKEISWNELLKTASGAADKSNYSQAEFLSLILEAKSIYGKKRKIEE